jgi:uncharacterized protein (DUF1501 family)
VAVTAAAAREQLQRIAAELDDLRFRLLGVQATLPEPIGESVKLLDVEEMDPSTEMRTVIGCVLSDWIGPAIRDLQDAAAFPEEAR